MRIFIAVSLLQLALFPEGSQGFVTISDGLICETITAKNATSFEVCAISYSEGPSPAVDDNETLTYIGNYIHDFLVYESFEGAAGTAQLQVDVEHHAGYNVRVERNGTTDECLVVAVNKRVCKSCTFCKSNNGGDTYSADCTNLRFGRNVSCESATNVFFPLTAEALVEEDEEVVIVSPPVETTTTTPPKTTTSDNKSNTVAASGGASSARVVEQRIVLLASAVLPVAMVVFSIVL
jgi:hypothetical protein